MTYTFPPARRRQVREEWRLIPPVGYFQTGSNLGSRGSRSRASRTLESRSGKWMRFPPLQMRLDESEDQLRALMGGPNAAAGRLAGV